mmetsp:Transcript_9961/g.25034  ORF Transcript_9961/g.25034 Transcript_9961/m.25034 type:complete len:290 (+) Transcript_9961:141-1010(+)
MAERTNLAGRSRGGGWSGAASCMPATLTPPAAGGSGGWGTDTRASVASPRAGSTSGARGLSRSSSRLPGEGRGGASSFAPAACAAGAGPGTSPGPVPSPSSGTRERTRTRPERRSILTSMPTASSSSSLATWRGTRSIWRMTSWFSAQLSHALRTAKRAHSRSCWLSSSSRQQLSTVLSASLSRSARCASGSAKVTLARKRTSTLFRPSAAPPGAAARGRASFASTGGAHMSSLVSTAPTLETSSCTRAAPPIAARSCMARVPKRRTAARANGSGSASDRSAPGATARA